MSVLAIRRRAPSTHRGGPPRIHPLTAAILFALARGEGLR